MLKLYSIIIVLFMLCQVGFSQNKQDKSVLPFILVDSPAQLSTMRQFNQNYISAYLFATNKLYEKADTSIADIIVTISSLFTLPLTHEEGHRSILTAQNIGAVSKPYPNKNLAAYVVGVSDATLIGLRNNNFTEYIRLHTAGLESDYCLSKRATSQLVYSESNIRGVYLDNLMRVLSDVFYLSSGLFKFNVDIKEENDELERDIVGHDIYGMARHLYRPDMEFFRYTEYEHLSDDERDFVKRIGYRGLMNLLSPVLFGKRYFLFKNGIRYNFSLGYSLSPFGDYIDENFWLVTPDKKILHAYFRQYQNKSNWFPAGGLSIDNINFFDEKLLTNVAIHAWSQPKNLAFKASDKELGFGVDFLFKFPLKLGTPNNVLSVDLGGIYKTYGFLPEELHMSEHLGLRLGTSIYIN